MLFKKSALILSLLILSTACTQKTVVENGEPNLENSEVMQTTETASVVKVVKTNGVYQLTVNGKPFDVKGVGLNYSEGNDFAALKAAGANSFRTWGSDAAAEELAAAKEHGLMVAIGFDLQKELHDFDYNNEQAVAEQFEAFKKVIDQYKDHPNVLAWIVGNEPNLLFDEAGALAMVNPKVYAAISDMIDYAHKVDPNHPVTYTFAGVVPEHIQTAMKYTPQVDIISVQVYGDVANVQETYSALNIDKPFFVTEYGPLGHWETAATEWGREIEEPSSVKAAAMVERIKTGLSVNTSGKSIGSFAFFWGQKQERTPTWYGMFLKDGSQTERIDEMTRYWTGAYPSNRSPQVHEIRINGLLPEKNIYLTPGQQAVAQVKFEELDGDAVTCKWTMRSEVIERSDGGAFEQEPGLVSFESNEQESDCDQGKLSFTAPEKSGDYRVFFYVYDGKGKAGYVNAPFMIKP